MDWETITRLQKTGKLPRHTQPTPTTIPLQRVLIFSDVHGLHYDPIAWQAMLATIPHLKPDRIIINGDLLDFYEISRYPKNPDVERSVAEELDHTKALLAELRTVFPDGPIDFVPGNHEERYELYVRNDAKKLEGLKVLELPNLLDFRGFGITGHQRDGFFLRSDYYVYHGDRCRAHAGTTARAELDRLGISGASGHTHRLATYRRSGILGRNTWSESGCLCNTNPEYVSVSADWQQGFVVVDFYSEKQGAWAVHDTEIVEGIARIF